jgi:hypothetical protein
MTATAIAEAIRRRSPRLILDPTSIASFDHGWHDRAAVGRG